MISFSNGISIGLASFFVSNLGNDNIVTSNLDASSVNNLGNLGVFDQPLGMAIEHLAGKMYIVDFLNDRVVQANLDGTSPRALNLDGSGAMAIPNPGGFLDRPFDILLDTVNGQMIIASSNNSSIVVSDLDGSNAVNLGNIGGFLDEPRGITPSN